MTKQISPEAEITITPYDIYRHEVVNVSTRREKSK